MFSGPRTMGAERRRSYPHLEDHAARLGYVVVYESNGIKAQFGNASAPKKRAGRCDPSHKPAPSQYHILGNEAHVSGDTWTSSAGTKASGTKAKHKTKSQRENRTLLKKLTARIITNASAETRNTCSVFSYSKQAATSPICAHAVQHENHDKCEEES